MSIDSPWEKRFRDRETIMKEEDENIVKALHKVTEQLRNTPNPPCLVFVMGSNPYHYMEIKHCPLLKHFSPHIKESMIQYWKDIYGYIQTGYPETRENNKNSIISPVKHSTVSSGNI